MTDVLNYDYVIYTGEPEFHYSRPNAKRKSNKLINTLTRLEVGQFVHFPTDRDSNVEKETKRNIKRSVEYVQRHYKPRRFRTGAAIHNNVWGITIQRREDAKSNTTNNLLTF